MTKIIAGKRYRMVKAPISGREFKTIVTWGYPRTHVEEYLKVLNSRENQIVIAAGKPFSQQNFEVVYVYLESNPKSRFEVITKCLEIIPEKKLYRSLFSGKLV